MLIMIKSAPDTPEGKRALRLARDTASDVCLMQNAVYFAHHERLEGFCGTVYVIEEDCRLRGLRDEGIEKAIKRLTYEGLVEVMDKEDTVVGLF